jgi:hypothetical protein
VTLPAGVNSEAYLVQVAARRLREALADLHAGGEAQPGKLLALEAAIARYVPDDKHWVAFILRDAMQDLTEGRSLALRHALPIEQKLRLFSCMLACFDPAIEKSKKLNGIQIIGDYLWMCFPGSKRCHVHGTRRRLPDCDLLLLDARADNGCYTKIPIPLTAYCIDYSGYRLMLTPRSIPRLTRLLDKLRDTFPAWVD